MRSINDRLRVGLDVVTPSTSSPPALIGRAWFVTAGSPDVYSTVSVPAGTKWIVARAIGGGGGTSSPYTTSVGAAGGAYGKAVFPLYDGDVVQYCVGPKNTTGNSGVTILRSGSTVQALLASGGASGANGTGVYLVASMSGLPGSSSAGGNPGNDLTDPETLYLTGVGASANGPASGFGGGAFTQQTGVSTFVTQAPSDGVVVLEYWTGDPR